MWKCVRWLLERQYSEMYTPRTLIHAPHNTPYYIYTHILIINRPWNQDVSLMSWMHKHSSTKKTSWVKGEITHEVTRWKPPQFIHNLQYTTFVREDYKDGLLTPEQHYSNQTLAYLLPGNNSSEINKLSGIATGYHWSHHR